MKHLVLFLALFCLAPHAASRQVYKFTDTSAYRISDTSLLAFAGGSLVSKDPAAGLGTPLFPFVQPKAGLRLFRILTFRDYPEDHCCIIRYIISGDNGSHWFCYNQDTQAWVAVDTNNITSLNFTQKTSNAFEIEQGAATFRVGQTSQFKFRAYYKNNGCYSGDSLDSIALTYYFDDTVTTVKLLTSDTGNAATEVKAKTLTTDASLTLHTAGYNQAGQFVKNVDASWNTGTFTPAEVSPVSGGIQLEPAATRQTTCTARYTNTKNNQLSASAALTVNPGQVDTVVLGPAEGCPIAEGYETFGGQPGDTLDIYANAYDADKNFVKTVNSNFSANNGGTSLSQNFTNASGHSTQLAIDRSGTTYITALPTDPQVVQNIGTDTVRSGPIVTVASLDTVLILPVATVSHPADTAKQIRSTFTISADSGPVLYAHGFDKDHLDSSLGLQSVTWEATGVASGCLSQSFGTMTVFRPVQSGTGTIKLTHAKSHRTIQITVTAGAPASLVIRTGRTAAAHDVETWYQSKVDPVTFFAAAYDADGNFKDNPSVTWTGTGLFSAVSAARDSLRLPAANALDSGTVMASSGALRDTAQIYTVEQISTIRILTARDTAARAGDSLTLKADQDLSLYVAGYSASGIFVSLQPVSWTENGTRDSLANNYGDSSIFCPVRTGRVTLVADHSQAGVTNDTLIINIIPGAVSKVTVTGVPGKLFTGQPLAVSLDVRDADSNAITGYSDPEWSVAGDIGGLTADTTNHATFLSAEAGFVQIRAMVDSVEGLSATMQVQKPVSGFVFIPNTDSIFNYATLVLDLLATNDDGETLAITGERWSVTDDSLAGIDSLTGAFRARHTGAVRVIASYLRPHDSVLIRDTSGFFYLDIGHAVDPAGDTISEVAPDSMVVSVAIDSQAGLDTTNIMIEFLDPAGFAAFTQFAGLGEVFSFANSNRKTFDSALTLTFSYQDMNLTGLAKDSLRLFEQVNNKWQIRYDAENDTAAEVLTLVTAVIGVYRIGIDRKAPVFSVVADLPDTSVAGQSISLRVTSTDNITNPKALLYYKAGGATEWDSVEVTITAGAGTVQVPGTALGDRGLVYMIKSTDGTNEVLQPEQQVLVTVHNLIMPYTLTPNDWVLFSIPINAAPPYNTQEYLLSSLGAYATDYRLFKQINDFDFEEWTTNHFTIDAGETYWLYTLRANQRVTIQQGVSYPALDDFELTLPAQTNPDTLSVKTFGLPFNFRVPLDSIMAHTGLDGADPILGYTDYVRLYGFYGRVGGVYIDPDSIVRQGYLEPWLGYMVWNFSGTNSYTLKIPPVEYQAGAGKVKTPSAAASWRLPVQLWMDNVSIDQRYLSSFPESRDGADGHDFAYPGLPGTEATGLLLTQEDNPGRALLTLSKPLTNGGNCWNITVTGLPAGAEASLALLDPETRLPSGYGVSVADPSGQVQLPLEGNRVTLAGRDGKPVNLKIIIGTRAYRDQKLLGYQEVPRAFALGQNHPNPFNPATVIRYALAGNHGRTAALPVRLEVYNLKGQLVKTLVNATQSSGYYQAVWGGDDLHGRKVASGFYFYRLQAGDQFRAYKKMVINK
jgi:hypothetical protein